MIELSPTLELRNVSKAFSGFQVLRDVSLKVEGGKTLALVGDNGAGKSTLIKILSGVHRPDSGKFLFNGEELNLRSPREARQLGIATVYQDLALINTLSIARNFFLGAEIKYGVGPLRLLNMAAMRARTEEYLSTVGVTRLRSPDEVVAVLSGGERQAIAIARAMYFGAKLIILDEPTSALSVRETRSVLDFVRQANERGITAVVISHNIHHVLPISDVIVALHQGEVAATFQRGEVDPTLLESVIMYGREALPGGNAVGLAE
jgi:simple sugar transport system ATP-binding protein